MAALAVAITALGLRRNVAWLRLWLLACLGVASHLLLDWTNSYGIRLLLPFSSRWFHADTSSLWDCVVLMALVLAAVWPLFARLVSSEIGEQPGPGRTGRGSAGRGRTGRGRGIAYTALAFYFVFECLRGLLHGRAVDELSARIYGGEVPIAVSAMPGPINPFRWAGIVETPTSFRELDVNLNIPLEPDFAHVIYKPALDRPIQMALTTEPFRYLRYFARFPAWSELPVSLAQGHGTRVDLTDLRFGAPGVGSFHAVALVNSQGRVLDSTFTFSSGREIGYADPGTTQK
jgi:inner membrane protein